MNRLPFLLCVSCLSVDATLSVGVVVAEDRIWADTTGKYTVKAEFIALESGNVTLKRADNGKVIRVPLSRLREADRKVALELNKPKSNPEPARDSAIKVIGTVGWSKFPSFDANGNQGARDLQLHIEARGKPAADAIEFGMLKVDSIKGDNGIMIAAKQDVAAFRDITKEFEKIDRSQEDFFAKHPTDGVRMTINLQPPQGLKQIIEAKGRFKIKTGGKRTTIKIPNAPGLVDKQLSNPEFKQLKVSAKVTIDDTTLALELEGEHAPIYQVEVKSPDGKKFDSQIGSGSGGGGRLMQYQFFFSDAIPQNATIFVHLAQDTVERELPFAVTNLKVPPAPP